MTDAPIPVRDTPESRRMLDAMARALRNLKMKGAEASKPPRRAQNR